MISGGILPMEFAREIHTKVLVLNQIAVPLRSGGPSMNKPYSIEQMSGEMSIKKKQLAIHGEPMTVNNRFVSPCFP